MIIARYKLLNKFSIRIAYQVKNVKPIGISQLSKFISTELSEKRS